MSDTYSFVDHIETMYDIAEEEGVEEEYEEDEEGVEEEYEEDDE